MVTTGRPGRSSVKNLWSALQTHLQGVDRAMLAIMPEKCRHRVALLSRLSDVKITRAVMERKSKPPPSQTRSRQKSDAALSKRIVSSRRAFIASICAGACATEDEFHKKVFLLDLLLRNVLKRAENRKSA